MLNTVRKTSSEKQRIKREVYLKTDKCFKHWSISTSVEKENINA